jgi:S-adenosylmethionine:tRNA ribosyltransferase-isomerase
VTLSPSASPDVGSCESWLALARPVKKLKIGQVFDLGHDLQATITNLPDQSKDGVQPIKVAFSLTGQSLLKWLENYGEVPLPPYISRKHAAHDSRAEDQTRYQTIYAGLNGSVAAPTAGLHFSKALIERLKTRGCEIHPITLHVGAGTFLPVKTQTIADHTMHSERFMINKSTLEAMSSAKALRRTVVLVGTTTFRAIEGFKEITRLTKKDPLELADTWQRTGIFIHPKTKEDRYEPWFGDALMTNFHQPESTLLMLVSAIFGYSRIQEIYKEAVAKSYRLFSYGDSSLLWFKS